MSQTPFSPTITAPLTDNNMEVDSDPEAEQAALEPTQAQEWVRATQEAREKHREERRRQEEERKAKIVAAEQAAELAVDRERRIQLQVSLGFLWPLKWKLTSDLAGLGGVGYDASTTASPLH